MKAALVFSAIFLSFSSGHISFIGGNLSAQVLLDSHSDANAATTWTITTTYPNELIIISAGGYGESGNALSTTPGTVTVNGNNATYENEGLWLSANFSWTASIWAYAAAIPGTYTCTCTETGLLVTLGSYGPFYFNYACSLYQDCPAGLNLGNIVVGGNNDNHHLTSINASITTTLHGAWMYGTVNNNDNGATGTVAWNGQLTELDHSYVNDGVDGAQADSTYFNPGTYTINSTDIGASNVWMTIALIAVQPNCCISAPVSLTKNATCYGDADGSATVNASGGTYTYTYSWTTVPAQTTAVATGLSAGYYTLTVTDENGCTATTATTITQPATTFKVNIPGPSTICGGSIVTLTANPIGGTNPYVYAWSSGLTSVTNTVSFTPQGSQNYAVIVTDANGCTASAAVSVNPLPEISFAANPPSGCAPMCVQLRDLTTISGSRIAQYVWTFGNGDSSHAQSPVYCYPSTGIYSVGLTVTSDSGCSATLKKDNYITVYSNPVARFTASPQPTTILNPTIQFTDASTDAYGIAEWNWTFGDGSDSASHNRNPDYTYRDTGRYCPTLAVMNIHGCTDTITNCLVINPMFTLYIPSAFTPNANGLNNVFEAKGSYIRSFEMYIFDRWGVELFHSTDINNGWNGTLKNITCQEDAYVYVITVYDNENTKHSYTGTVNLLK